MSSRTNFDNSMQTGLICPICKQKNSNPEIEGDYFYCKICASLRHIILAKKVSFTEFDYTVRKVGNSGMIGVSKNLIGKKVKVCVEILE